jgi:hypothetical protein
MRILRKVLLGVASAGLCLAAMPAAQSAPLPGSASIAIARPDENGRRALASVPVQNGQAGLDLVVLIDESLSQRVDVQLKEIGDFLQTLPAGARVAVAYASYGGVRYTQDFTTDHEKAARAFHMPSAFPGTANGLYDSVTDLIKKWPTTQNRRVILLISDGIDVTDGRVDSNPDMNTVLQRAIHQAEQSGVTVDSIFAAGSGRTDEDRLLVLNGQGCLSQLAAKTGGNAFFEGTETPLSFRPFLRDIAKTLSPR